MPLKTYMKRGKILHQVCKGDQNKVLTTSALKCPWSEYTKCPKEVIQCYRRRKKLPVRGYDFFFHFLKFILHIIFHTQCRAQKVGFLKMSVQPSSNEKWKETRQSADWIITSVIIKATLWSYTLPKEASMNLIHWTAKTMRLWPW